MRTETKARALFEEALSHHRAGDLKAAEALYLKLLDTRPNHPQIQHMLGVVLTQQGRNVQALTLLEAASKNRPHDPIILLNTGNTLQNLGRFEQALACYDGALKLTADNADLYNNRGNALRALGRYQEALASFDKSLALRPDDAHSLYNRANVLLDMKLYDQALLEYDRALKIDPGYPEAWNNRANTLSRLSRPQEALIDYERALALRPSNLEFRMNHGGALWQLKRFGQALSDFDLVRAQDPLYPNAFNESAVAVLHICNWQRVEEFERQMRLAVLNAKPEVQPWTLLNYSSDGDLQRRCAQNTVRTLMSNAQCPLAPKTDYGHSKLRIGYISADYRAHPVGFQIVRLLELHDRSHFEIVGISNGPDDASEIRKRLVRACDQFYAVSGQSQQDIARLLRELEIDIAIDLSGHTNGNCLSALAWRPSPIQASWLGFPATTGAPFIDYIIADCIVAPFAHQEFYSEKIVHLPHSFFVIDDEAINQIAVTRSQEGLPEHAFVYCCFNNSWKIGRATFESWMNILHRAPASVLWLRHYSDEAAAALCREAQKLGIDPMRLIFAKSAPLEVHLCRHGLADLFLDTLPYNAHTTMVDALRAGLPAITQTGETFQGRVAASLLHAAGLEELVTHSKEDYQNLAVDLARSRERLARLRDLLQKRKGALFDTELFARGIERAYLAMHALFKSGQTAKSFAI